MLTRPARTATWHRAAALALAAALPAGEAVAALTADEIGANAALRRSADPSSLEGPIALRPALAALCLQLGQRERALAALSASERGDCFTRALLQELSGEGACPGQPPSPLPETDTGPVVAARLIGALPDETTSSFFAAVIGAATRALESQGDRTLEVTTDRFRVGGPVSIVGRVYREGRMLLTARAREPDDAAAAREALERLSVARGDPWPDVEPPEPVHADPADPAIPVLSWVHQDVAAGFELRLPDGWTRQVLPRGTVGFGPHGSLDHATEAPVEIAVSRPADSRRRRNPVARRRAKDRPPTPTVLPPGIRVLQEADHPLGGGRARLVTWDQGALRQTGLVRQSATAAGAVALLVRLPSGDAAGLAWAEAVAASLRPLDAPR